MEQISPLTHQVELFDSGILEGTQNAVIQAPTGFGKTRCSQHSIQIQLEQGHRVIYLSATRALANELFETWQSTFTPYQVGVFTGDFTAKPPVPLNKARVMILTPERLDISLRFWKQNINWLSEVSLIIADEIHLVDRSNTRRGVCLESSICRFLRFNPFARVIGLSATLGNREELAKWLKGVDFVSKHRPIPLEWNYGLFKKPAQKPDIALGFIEQSIKAKEQTIIFVQSRRRAESLSKFFSEAEIRSAFHHAGLELSDRRQIESDFRTQKLDVLVATPTLELGVNLPCQTTILYDSQQWTQGHYEPLSTNTAWQRAGRAGRWKGEGIPVNPGKAIIICPSWNYKSERDFPKGAFEPIQSGLRNFLHEQILIEVASGFCFTISHLEQAFSHSLAAHQRQQLNIEETVQDMLDAGILCEYGQDGSQKLGATPIGFVANRHQLLPQTIKILRQILEKEQNLELFDLLVVIARCPDFSVSVPLDYEYLEGFADALQLEPSLLLDSSNEEAEKLLGLKGKAVLTTLNVAHICRQWTHSGDKQSTATKCHCYPFEVGQIKDEMERLLSAMIDLLPVLPMPEEPQTKALKEKVEVLRQMVATGLNEQHATLTLVKGLGPKLARSLVNAGIQDIEDLALADSEALKTIPGVGEKRSQEWVITAEEWVNKHYSAYSFKGEAPYRPTLRSMLPQEIDVYAFNRAYELQVDNKETYFAVSGGEDEHQVKWTPVQECDCGADPTKVCKHRIAVGLHLKDPTLTEALQYAYSGKSQNLDVFQLWWKASSSDWGLDVR